MMKDVEGMIAALNDCEAHLEKPMGIGREKDRYRLDGTIEPASAQEARTVAIIHENVKELAVWRMRSLD
jgi:hypothetical protein